MKQLQTYFALFATLISVLAMALVFGTCAVFGHVNPALAFVILPISAVVLAIGMAVGHYLAEPLKALAAHVKQCRRNGGSGPSPENGVYREAHDLSEQFRLLYEDAESNRKELANVESNQSAFVSDVAHELRTPLTAIRGNAEMLQDPDLPPELHERFCNSIVRESERLTRLTTDIISLERNRDDDQAREWHRVNLRDVAQDAIDSIAPVLAERGANVSLEGEAPDVLGDRDHLEEVVTNLVDNQPLHQARRPHLDRACRYGNGIHHLRLRRWHRIRRCGPAYAVRALLPHGFQPRTECRRLWLGARHREIHH